MSEEEARARFGDIEPWVRHFLGANCPVADPDWLTGVISLYVASASPAAGAPAPALDRWCTDYATASGAAMREAAQVGDGVWARVLICAPSRKALEEALGTMARDHPVSVHEVSVQGCATTASKRVDE